MYIDIICYITLLCMLVYLTRVVPAKKIKVIYNGSALPGRILKCNTGLMNRVGLLNTPALAPGDGLYLPGVKKIHTVGMYFPIDIIFLDDTKRVLSYQKSVEPGQKKIRGPRGTSSVLELGGGSIEKFTPDLALYLRFEVEPWK